MRLLFPVLTFLLLAQSAVAGPKRPHWGEWQTGGDCRDSNTQFIENGDALSVLYDDLGVNMPQRQTGDGLEARRQCTFRIEVQPPAGMYLAQVRQLYSGGLIKSKLSAAHMNARYRIGTFREKVLDLDWKHGEEVTPESPRSLFSQSTDDVVPYEQCRKRNRFVVNLNVSAKRKGFDEFVVGGLDSTDIQFVHKLILLPIFRPCR